MESLYDLPPTLEMESRVTESTIDEYEAPERTKAKTSLSQSSLREETKSKTHSGVVVTLVLLFLLIVICMGVISYGAFIVLQMKSDIEAGKDDSVKTTNSNVSDVLQLFQTKMENKTADLETGLNRVQKVVAQFSQINQTTSELRAVFDTKIAQIITVVYKTTGWLLNNSTLYKLFSTSQTWTQAQQKCENLTASLAFKNVNEVTSDVIARITNNATSAWISGNCNLICPNGTVTNATSCDQTAFYICEMNI